MTVDFAAARQFLAALGKRKSSIRLRGFYDKHDPRKADDPGAKGEPTKDLVTSWVEDRRGVYVVINNGGDTDADITDCIALFCEWDDRPKDWQVTAWQELGLPEPSLQVDTGGKSVHSYWILSAPATPDQWRATQRRLLDHAGADRSLKNPSRVMRLPGCPHPQTGVAAAIIHQSSARYDIDEFTALLPETPVVDHQRAARAFTDYEAQGLDEIQRALQCIPPRVPGTGTYDMYRNILWGLIKACEEAGSSADTAIDLMEYHSPEWKGIDQVARSGGTEINAGTFWYWAKDHGYRPAVKVRQGPAELVAAARPPEIFDEEPSPDVEPETEPDKISPVLPFRPLGFDHGIYFYLPSSACQVIPLSAAQHNQSHFLQLAPLEWWANGFGDEKGRIDWQSAANAVMSACIAQGVYDPSRVRGRGAWADDGRVILHLGNRLVVDGHSHAITRLPRDFSSLYFYENAKAIDGPGKDTLSDDLALKIQCIAERFRWETPASANLLLGWIVLGPVCGALDWRPHIWVTGGAGTGKAQPHSAKVLTPTGWRTMGDVKIGDLVSIPDNGFARIRGKYPQGVQPTYRITLAEGRSTRATGDHLWKVRIRGGWYIQTTDEIIRELEAGEKDLIIPTSTDQIGLSISSIKPDAPEECSCIAIDHPDRLYITDDFIVTHNTTILKSFMKPLLGGMFEGATGGTTEAGLRGQLRSDAIPVVFDELEQNEQKDKQTVQNILALARIASSEGGKIYKGTTNGGSNSFEIRSMFCCSSINVALIQRADLDRFCVLGLRKDQMDKDDWNEFEQQILEACTEENGRRLVARTLEQIPTIRKNAKTLATALAKRFGQRFGDQYGTLLAGAWSLEPAGGGLLDLETAKQWINSMDWESRDNDDSDADEMKCRDAILQHLVDYTGGQKAQLGELVRCVAQSESLGGVLYEDLAKVLARWGLKVFRKGLDRMPGLRQACECHYVAVSHSNRQLATLFRDTQWSNNAHRAALKRLSGAITMTKPLYFSGVGTQRATLVPIDTSED